MKRAIPLRNADREMLVFEYGQGGTSEGFLQDVAEALLNGSARVVVPEGDARSVEHALRHVDAVPRRRNARSVPRLYETILEHTAEYDLVEMTGMTYEKGAYDDSPRNADGTPVTVRTAVARISRLAARISAMALTHPRTDWDSMPALEEMMVATALATTTLLPGQDMIITAPSPWKRGTLHVIDPIGETSEEDIDPVLETMLPCVMTVEMQNDAKERTGALIIAPHVTVVSHDDMPTSLDVARTLAARWRT